MNPVAIHFNLSKPHITTQDYLTLLQKTSTTPNSDRDDTHMPNVPCLSQLHCQPYACPFQPHCDSFNLRLCPASHIMTHVPAHLSLNHDSYLCPPQSRSNPHDSHLRSNTYLVMSRPARQCILIPATQLLHRARRKGVPSPVGVAHAAHAHHDALLLCRPAQPTTAATATHAMVPAGHVMHKNSLLILSSSDTVSQRFWCCRDNRAWFQCPV